MALLSKNFAQSATVMAFRDAFLVGAGIVAVALITAFLLPSKSTGHTTDETTEKGVIEDIAGLE